MRGKLDLFSLMAIFFLLILPSPILAESSYVLPYPSFMPGNIFYKINFIQEKLDKYWYFGNFSKFTYNLKLADKYLIEAKTLFEYKQYLLANEALKKSDKYFIEVHLFLGKAKLEGKNTTEKEQILKEAAIKHGEILEQLKVQVPKEFLWEPEKEKSTPLFLWEEIDHSIEIRRSCQ